MVGWGRLRPGGSADRVLDPAVRPARRSSAAVAAERCENGDGLAGRSAGAPGRATHAAERDAKGDIDEAEYRADEGAARTRRHRPDRRRAARRRPTRRPRHSHAAASRACRGARGQQCDADRTATTTIIASGTVHPPVASCSAPMIGAPSADQPPPCTSAETSRPPLSPLRDTTTSVVKMTTNPPAWPSAPIDEPQPHQLGREQHPDGEDDPGRADRQRRHDRAA